LPCQSLNNNTESGFLLNRVKSKSNASNRTVRKDKSVLYTQKEDKNFAGNYPLKEQESQLNNKEEIKKSLEEINKDIAIKKEIKVVELSIKSVVDISIIKSDYHDNIKNVPIQCHYPETEKEKQHDISRTDSLIGKVQEEQIIDNNQHSENKKLINGSNSSLGTPKEDNIITESNKEEANSYDSLTEGMMNEGIKVDMGQSDADNKQLTIEVLNEEANSNYNSNNTFKGEAVSNDIIAQDINLKDNVLEENKSKDSVKEENLNKSKESIDENEEYIISSELHTERNAKEEKVTVINKKDDLIQEAIDTEHHVIYKVDENTKQQNEFRNEIQNLEESKDYKEDSIEYKGEEYTADKYIIQEDTLNKKDIIDNICDNKEYEDGVNEEHEENVSKNSYNDEEKQLESKEESIEGEDSIQGDKVIKEEEQIVKDDNSIHIKKDSEHDIEVKNKEIHNEGDRTQNIDEYNNYITHDNVSKDDLILDNSNIEIPNSEEIDKANSEVMLSNDLKGDMVENINESNVLTEDIKEQQNKIRKVGGLVSNDSEECKHEEDERNTRTIEDSLEEVNNKDEEQRIEVIDNNEEKNNKEDTENAIKEVQEQIIKIKEDCKETIDQEIPKEHKYLEESKDGYIESEAKHTEEINIERIESNTEQHIVKESDNRIHSIDDREGILDFFEPYTDNKEELNNEYEKKVSFQQENEVNQELTSNSQQDVESKVHDSTEGRQLVDPFISYEGYNTPRFNSNREAECTSDKARGYASLREIEKVTNYEDERMYYRTEPDKNNKEGNFSTFIKESKGDLLNEANKNTPLEEQKDTFRQHEGSELIEVVKEDLQRIMKVNKSQHLKNKLLSLKDDVGGKKTLTRQRNTLKRYHLTDSMNSSLTERVIKCMLLESLSIKNKEERDYFVESMNAVKNINEKEVGKQATGNKVKSKKEDILNNKIKKYLKRTIQTPSKKEAI